MGKKKIYFLLVFLIAISLFVIFGFQKDKSTIMVDGVLFKSTIGNPSLMPKQFAEEADFVVSTVVNHDPVIETDSMMFNSSALFIVVLSGNQKNIVQLVRVIDSGGNLSYCLSNKGDLKTEERLEALQCQELLESKEKVVVIISPPDNSLPAPTVVFSEKKITIEAKDFDTLGTACFTVLRAMFSNAAEVLENSNNLSKQLG